MQVLRNPLSTDRNILSTLWSKKNRLKHLRNLKNSYNSNIERLRRTAKMSNYKLSVAFLFAVVLSAAFTFPVFAQEYSPGVVAGQYVKYGNFVGAGPGFESFNDYDWLKLEIISVSRKEVTLLSTGQFKNGTLFWQRHKTVWNIEAGTEDDTPSTQGPIIAANLNQGDAIQPPGTYTVNKTEDRTYLGVSRSVNILDVEISTPDYNTSLTYVYDRGSGMILESTSITTQAQPEPTTSEYAYSIIETDVFGSTPTNLPIAVIIAVALVVVTVAVAVVLLLRRTKETLKK
jgi:hypothetical protein